MKLIMNSKGGGGVMVDVPCCPFFVNIQTHGGDCDFQSFC